jgi:hypothetical protein
MGWTTGLQFSAGAKMGIFLFATMSRPGLGPTQTPIQCVSGILIPEVKWLGHEADHLPPSSSEIKNVWSYTSTPQYAFMAWCLIKQWMSLRYGT